MISAGLASAFATRVGVRLVAAIGLIVSIIRMLLLVRLPVDGSHVADVLPSILLTSLGMGAVFMPLTLIATTSLNATSPASWPRRRRRPFRPDSARNETPAAATEAVSLSNRRAK